MTPVDRLGGGKKLEGMKACRVMDYKGNKGGMFTLGFMRADWAQF